MKNCVFNHATFNILIFFKQLSHLFSFFSLSFDRSRAKLVCFNLYFEDQGRLTGYLNIYFQCFLLANNPLNTFFSRMTLSNQRHVANNETDECRWTTLAQQQLYGLIGSSIPARDACILFGCINQQMGNFHTSPENNLNFPIEIESCFLHCIGYRTWNCTTCRLCDAKELCLCSNLALVMSRILNRHMLDVHSPDLN